MAARTSSRPLAKRITPCCSSVSIQTAHSDHTLDRSAPGRMGLLLGLQLEQPIGEVTDLHVHTDLAGKARVVVRLQDTADGAALPVLPSGALDQFVAESVLVDAREVLVLDVLVVVIRKHGHRVPFGSVVNNGNVARSPSRRGE
jgi:hypothetical protein